MIRIDPWLSSKRIDHEAKYLRRNPSFLTINNKTTVTLFIIGLRFIYSFIYNISLITNHDIL